LTRERNFVVYFTDLMRRCMEGD